QGDVGFLESRRISSDNWRIEFEEISDPQYKTFRYDFITPKRTLSMVTQSNIHTTWVSEHLVKEKSDIDIIAEFATEPLCDVAALNKIAAEFGERGLVRGHICYLLLRYLRSTRLLAGCLLSLWHRKNDYGSV
ncbi:MAG: hypothetical protein MUC94_14760, partial [bacterium]|nr:hypothetical protein [bacterium]